MYNEKKLENVIEFKICKKRIEKSKYFTEIFFRKHPMKYRELFEEYEKIFFKDNVYYKVDKKYMTDVYKDSMGEEDTILASYFSISNDRIETIYNDIIFYIERLEDTLEDYEEDIEMMEDYIEESEDSEDIKDFESQIEDDKEEIERIKKLLEIYPKIENYIPIHSEPGFHYLLINKLTGAIEFFMRDPISIDKYTGLFKIADSLDEFIDKLYIEKTENRVVNIAQGRKVLKEMDEYIKERDKFKNE